MNGEQCCVAGGFDHPKYSNNVTSLYSTATRFKQINPKIDFFGGAGRGGVAGRDGLPALTPPARGFTGLCRQVITMMDPVSSCQCRARVLHYTHSLQHQHPYITQK